MSSRTLTRSVAAAGAVALAVGAFAIGSASSDDGGSATPPTAQVGAPGQAGAQGHGAGAGPAGARGEFAPAGTPAGGQVPQDWSPGSGTIVTGAAADQAKAAALDAGYSGTVNRVLKLSDGSYAVHMFATQGPHHVFVSKDFKVTGAATGG